MTPIFIIFARYPRPIAIKIMRNSDFQAQLFKLSYALALSGFCLLSPTATYSQSGETPEFSVPIRIIDDKASQERARLERAAQEQHDAEDLIV